MSAVADHRPVAAIPPLTSLRFFAAMVVVVFHYNPDKFATLPGVFQSWLETGYEAVTFFFVLSGFILYYVYAESGFSQRGSVRRFLVARLGRLAPAYFLALAIALPIYIEESLRESDRTGAELVVHVALVLTAMQSWWPDAALAWNPPSWSMSVEWFFYLTFPLTLPLVRRLAPTLLLPGALILVAAVAAFRLWVLDPLAQGDPKTWGNFAAFFPVQHLPQFLFGMALGRVYAIGPRPAPALAAGMFAAGLLGLMALFMNLDELPGHIRSNAVLVIFFGMLIYGAATAGHAAYRLLSPAPLVFLGEASYAIYALHEPIAAWWERFAPALIGENPSSWIDFPIYIGLVIVLASLCYRYVETPLRRRIRRWAEGPPAQAGRGT
ncbi:MAG: acyltransferase [Alphaproteobacteria bacterium]